MKRVQPARHEGEIPVLLRGDATSIVNWIERPSGSRIVLWITVISLGTGLFGASVGYWRDPLQSVYAAMKFPLVLLLTASGNALLNAMLAPLLGVNLGLRQTQLAILMSFTISAAILGALSPIIFFLVWNTPPISDVGRVSFSSHSLIQVSQVASIAFAGIAGNVRLWQVLRRQSANRSAAGRVLFAWLAGNLFLGSQVSWILRPFVGSPGLPVKFLRPDAFHGSFFESVFQALLNLLK